METTKLNQNKKSRREKKDKEADLTQSEPHALGYREEDEQMRQLHTVNADLKFWGLVLDSSRGIDGYGW